MRAVTQFTPTDIVVTYNNLTAKLQIVCTAPYASQLDIYPDGLLTEGVSNWNSQQSLYQLDANNTQSAGKVCGFMGNVTISASVNITGQGDSVVDVQRHHCCYIHSNLGTPGSSYGPQGQSDIIRRVLIDAPQNGLSIDRHTTPHDNVEVNGKTLRSMTFRLAGSDGKTVDLRGHHWSFSIIFHQKI